MRALLLAVLLVGGASLANATPTANMTRLPAFQSPVPLVQVQSRFCRACRNACSRERRYCGYANWCRREFTLCMRACWEDYCR